MIRKLVMTAAGVWVCSLAISCSSPAATADESGTSVAKPVAQALTPDVLDRGRGIYKVYCAPCHGESGRGDGPGAAVMKPGPRDHTDRAYMSTLTDEDLAKLINMGGAIKGKPLMPGNPQITGADLKALVAYTRSLSTD
jgi:mono/diheme cytochrome c family protein